MEKKSIWDERLFLLAYVLWLFYAVLNITLWCDYEIIASLCQYMRRTAFLLLLIRILLRRRYTVKDIAGIFVIIFCNIIARNSVHNLQIVATSILVYCAADLDFKKILKCTFAVQAVIMVSTIAASQVGILEDIVWTDGGRIRYSLGYEYCGYPAHLLLFMTLMWFCIRQKLHILDAVIWLGLNWVMYCFTVSRTDFYLAVFGIVGFFVWIRPYHLRYMNQLRNFLMKYGFILAAVVSILAQWLYNADYTLLARINLVLNGRLELGHNAIETYGLPLFGEQVKWIGQGGLRANPELVYNYVDNAFLKETISFGILFLVLLAAGYYYVGRKMVHSHNHKLGWAVLISLAYGVINAHLCMIAFNVFILLLGSCFDAGESKAGKSLPELIAELSVARISQRKKRWVRIGLFFAIFIYLTYVQMRGFNYMISHRSMHCWVICGFLFTLILFCAEEEARDFKNRKFLHVTTVFLLFACMSDFVLNKRFVYSSFFCVLFGGMLVSSWGRMEHPKQLILDFKHGYKLWFGAVVLFSAVFCPALPGICYSGIFSSANTLGICALIAAAVFFSDCERPYWGILNTGGVALSLYLVWTTQQFFLILIAGILCLMYGIFKIIYFKDTDARCRRIGIVQTIVGILAGIGCVLGMRIFLYQLTPLLGPLSWNSGTPEYIEYTVIEAVRSEAWMDIITDKLQLFREYIWRRNWLGHDYIANIAGRKQWPENSLLMNLYRYGIPAGIAYAVFLAGYLWRAFHHTVHRKDFFSFGVAGTCIAVAMTEMIELPFVHIGWFVFYFIVAWILVLDKGETDAVFKYRN